MNKLTEGLKSAKQGVKARLRVGRAQNVNERDTGPGLLQHMEMAHARLGVLYIFGNAKVEGSFASVILDGLTATAGGLASGVSKEMGDAGAKIASAVLSPTNFTLKKVTEWAEDSGAKVHGALAQGKTKAAPGSKERILFVLDQFKTNLWAKITEKLEVDPGVYFGLIKKVLSGCASYIAAQASVVGGALDIVKGTTQAANSAWRLIDTWLTGRQVSFVNGHPTIIIDGLRRAMGFSMGEGLWNILKGSIQIGVDAVTGFAGTLSKAVMACFEMITKVLWRVFDLCAIEKFCGEAKELYTNRNTNMIHYKPDVFAKWFKKYALTVPVISCVALNCGYCGGPMHYLNMWQDDGTPITQSQFDMGTGLLARLKTYAAYYQTQTGMYFYSSDKVVHGALNAAKDYAKVRNIGHNTLADWTWKLATA